MMDEKSVHDVFDKLIDAAKNTYPNANILGITLEPMIRSENTREVMIGVISDKVFGPVISFGSGGTFVEIHQDRALELPPLNRFLIEKLISRTKIAKALTKFRNLPPANIEALINILLRVSELICALPYIREMDINPIMIDDKNAIAVDVRIVIEDKELLSPYSHMAIHP